jgi:hypothetical protein
LVDLTCCGVPKGGLLGGGMELRLGEVVFLIIFVRKGALEGRGARLGFGVIRSPVSCCWVYPLVGLAGLRFTLVVWINCVMLQGGLRGGGGSGVWLDYLESCVLMPGDP